VTDCLLQKVKLWEIAEFAANVFFNRTFFSLYFFLLSISGLPDFSWYSIPKREKYTIMTTKYTKWP
jgi:hypothetical protein